MLEDALLIRGLEGMFRVKPGMKFRTAFYQIRR